VNGACCGEVPWSAEIKAMVADAEFRASLMIQ